MKLIDILVQELPKRGGWPGAIPALVQNSSAYIYQAGGGECIHRLELADDWMDAEVTCEKYFDALRALKPVWDGEELPPVGVECEFKRATGEWVQVEITAIARNGLCFVEPGKTGENYVSFSREFRPMRSEADKKRDATCDAMHKSWREVAGNTREDGSLIDIYSCIYDAIAAGKIPHIRID